MQKQNKEFIQCFLSAGRRSVISCNAVFHHGDCYRNAECPSFLLRPRGFYCGVVVWCEISLGSVWVSHPGCVPSQLREHPQPARWWGTVRSRTALGAVQMLLCSG